MRRATLARRGAPIARIRARACGTLFAFGRGMRKRVVRGARIGRARGVTLFEVLIVVAIIALISAGVALAAIKFFDSSRVRTAATNARTIRGAVKTWWIEHDQAECPGVDELIRAGTLDRDSTRVDPWGETWRVECAERDVTVISTGPDRKPGTPDDILIPPA